MLRVRQIRYICIDRTNNLIVGHLTGSGLQLYLAKDGTVTFDKKSSNRDQELKPVVMSSGNPRR